MNRVVVVGPPGSGKTTLAATLAERLGAPHTELDGLWWEPGWTEAGPERFAAKVAPVVAGERWVVDGNYYSVGGRDHVWPRADTVVWLDMARWVTVPRAWRRTFRRCLLGTELWGTGNTESLRVILRSDSLLWFAWREHPKYNRRYEGLDADPSLGHLRWVRLRSPREVRRWLLTVPSRSGA